MNISIKHRKPASAPAAPAPSVTELAAPSLEDVRLQVDLPAEFAQEVMRLKETCGFGTRRETVVAALSTLMWVVREILAGRRVGSIDAAGTTFNEMVPMGARLVPQYLRNAEAARAQAKPAYAHV